MINFTHYGNDKVEEKDWLYQELLPTGQPSLVFTPWFLFDIVIRRESGIER